jgi:hypothetical protein
MQRSGGASSVSWLRRALPRDVRADAAPPARLEVEVPQQVAGGADDAGDGLTKAAHEHVGHRYPHGAPALT